MSLSHKTNNALNRDNIGTIFLNKFMWLFLKSMNIYIKDHEQLVAAIKSNIVKKIGFLSPI